MIIYTPSPDVDKVHAPPRYVKSWFRNLLEYHLTLNDAKSVS